MHNDKAELFKALHIPGIPIMLYNVWDPGSAKAVAAAGAQAIATGSWSVAAATGFKDGEAVPLDLALDNLARIARTVELPVTVDIESGYGATPDEVARTIERAIAAGAIGCNIEDSYPETGKIRSPGEQFDRIRAARTAADRLGQAFFINARCDVFLGARGSSDDGVVIEALDRARSYADAGANGFFTPGVTNLSLMKRLASESPLPLNVMVGVNEPPLRAIAEVGVARVSFGPAPYVAAMEALTNAARSTAVLGLR
jgi:2-methylisocitrate lyase-like PEP mutase family enzyme